MHHKDLARLLFPGFYYGHGIHIQAEGTDELQVIEGISALVKSNFSYYKHLVDIFILFLIIGIRRNYGKRNIKYF